MAPLNALRTVFRATPHYPPEFKREALRLFRSSERSFSEVAKESQCMIKRRSGQWIGELYEIAKVELYEFS
jgi:transposase-like protein